MCFSSFNKGQATGAIFIDLSKAFDIVNHYLPLDKLYSIGLTRNALLCLILIFITGFSVWLRNCWKRLSRLYSGTITFAMIYEWFTSNMLKLFCTCLCRCHLFTPQILSPELAFIPHIDYTVKRTCLRLLYRSINFYISSQEKNCFSVNINSYLSKYIWHLTWAS